jgi:glycosyltransferase involved in cell wall biosynthesis|tara:strand:- start:362 stop:1495 length:1134 start_codon:yes stop_codon:yes gene_type:complete
MKIMFLIRSLQLGGAERQLVNLAIGLKERGHTISVAFLYSGGPLQSQLQSAGINYYSMNKKDRWDVYNYFSSLLLTVKRERPHIIHGYGAVPNVLSIVLKLFYRDLKVVWGVRASYLDMKKYDLFTRIVYKVECFLSSIPSLVISNSEAGRKYAISNGFSEKNIRVVYNGIETQRFRKNELVRYLIRDEWSIRQHTLVIGVVGRVEIMKDHATFIKSMKQVFQQCTIPIMVICIGGGDHDLLSKLKSDVSNYHLEEYFIWEKERTDIPRCMNGIDLLVSSSYGEGFSNVIAEAMATGVPCVVTDVGDSAHIVGDCGEVVRARDVEAIAEGILRMVSKLSDGKTRHALARCSTQRIKDNFSLDRMILDSERFLNTLEQ